MENQLNNEFIDADAFFTKNGFSFQQIVLEHLRKIGQLAAVEWRGGYINQTQTINGNIIQTKKEYIPDTREVLSNAIYFLDLLLAPHYDQEMKDQETKILYDLDGLEDKDRELHLHLNLLREMSFFLKRKGYLEAVKGAE